MIKLEIYLNDLSDSYNNNIVRRMYGFIINNKMEKCRENIDSYMSSGNSQAIKRNQSNPMISRTTSQAFPSANTISQTANLQSIKSTSKPNQKNQIQLENVNFNLRKYDQGQMLLKFSKEEGLMTVFYQDQAGKVRIDVKREDLKGKRIDADLKRGTLNFTPKTLIVKKLDNKESNKANAQWVNFQRQKQASFYVTLKNKDQVKEFKENAFCEGIIDQEGSSYLEGLKPVPQPDDIPLDDQDHANPKFTVPSSQQLAETEKLRKTIREMKEEDKISVLMDIFKIKKEYVDPESYNKKLKCPISKCGKSYREIQLLKTHLKAKHPELARHGIQLTEYDGSFQYNNKALDLALYLGKIEPNQMKKIVKQMKTKTQAE